MRNKRFPKYPDDADYNTNSPSYYDDLARKQKLIELLAKKIWEYEETLDLTLEEISERLETYIQENDNLMSDRLAEWDLRLEKFPENVEMLLQEWLSDGTLDHIINDTIFNWKADQVDLDKVNEQLANTWKSLESFPRLPDETDDTGRFRRLIDATNEGETAFIPFINEWYIISDTILVDKPIDFVSKGRIGYAGERNKSAFVFKSMTKRNIEMNRLYDITSVEDSYYGWHGWENDNYVGVELNNLKQCVVNIKEIRNFTTNLKARATNGRGFWFNHITFVESMNARVHLEINSDGNNSWFNANYFYDTSFGYTSTNTKFSSENFERFSILQTLTNGNAYGGNSNIFRDLKFEMNVTLNGGFTQIYLKKATDWVFEFRNELGGTGNKLITIDLLKSPGVTTLGAHSRNIVLKPSNMTYDTTIDFINNDEIFNNYQDIVRFEPTNKMYTVYEENNLVEKARKLNNNDLILKGYHFMNLNSVDFDNFKVGNYSGSILGNGVNVASTTPLVFSLENLKKGDLIEVISKGENNTNRAVLKVLDKENNIIPSFYDVDGVKTIASWYGFSNTTKNITPGINNGELKFNINSDKVGKVLVLLYGHIENFKILSNSREISVNKNVNEYPSEKFKGSTKPTTFIDGGFDIGDVVYRIGSSFDNTGWLLDLTDNGLEWIEF